MTADAAGFTLGVEAGGVPCTDAEVVAAWADPAFALAWTRALAGLPFEAILWECRRITSTARPFASRCLEHRRLAALQGRSRAFRDQLTGDAIVAFDNLSGSARLVAPDDDGRDHGHLLRFLRHASKGEAVALWATVSDEAGRWMASGRPLYLSTHGLGVPWLHVRLEGRPKYYAHQPYRTER